MNAQSDPRTEPFADFVPLPENLAGFAAINRLGRALLHHKRTPWLTLTLHGPTGTGKSALVTGLVQSIISGPDLTARIVSASDLGRSERDDFADLAPTEFDACDLLIVEDIHRLPRNHGEQIVNLIDRRHRIRRPTVLTSRHGPANLPEFSARLASRGAGGLVVGLEPLGPVSRMQLARALLDRQRLHVTEAVLTWLVAQADGGSARPLIGGVRQLEVLARVHPMPLDEDVISAQIPQTDESDVSPVERIIERVGTHFRIKPKALRGQARHRDTLWARQVSMWLARQLTGLSLGQIGTHFDGRDHTTVLHACRKVEQAAEQDAALAAELRRLQAELA